MNKQSISFKADEQKLTKTGGIEHYASNIVAYIEATFDLGTNWNGYDSVRAVWSNDYLTDISTVLDSNGKCIVPTEVLTDTGNVTVNLVGSIADGDTLTDRLTTYPCRAVVVDADAKVEGDETESITPSQFEQFVEIVHDEVEQVTGMTAEAETLPAGSDATASYSEGVLSLGIPKGDKGDTGETGATGNGIASTVLNPDYTLTITFTDGTSYTTPSIRGAKGDTGNTGATGNGIQSTVLNADYTLTITFTDGTSYTTPSIRGEQGPAGPVSDVTVNGTSVVDQNGIAKILMPELVKTVNGNPIVLDDAFGPVKNLTVELLPIQEGSGTPSPQNIRPITGHDSVTVGVTGVNQWDEEWESGYYNDSDGLPASNATRIRTKNRIKVYPSTAYYFVAPKSGQIFYYDKDDNFISTTPWFRNAVITTPSTCEWLRFYLTSTPTYENDAGINLPSTDTDYHAYHGQSKTVTLPHTVYGAGVGVTSGNGKEKMAIVDLGTLDYFPYTTSGVNYFYTEALQALAKRPATASDKADIMCTIYPIGIASDITTTEKYVWLYTNGNLCIKDPTYATAAELKTALSGVYLCYELATPTDLSTTPTDLTLYNGDNVISSDGDMELSYVQDMAIVIEKLENLL